MLEAGVEIDVDQLAEDLGRRDAIDSQRAHSPLTPAYDAVIINTDAMSIEQVVQRIVELAR
jgi:cytidylate kinase